MQKVWKVVGTARRHGANGTAFENNIDCTLNSWFERNPEWKYLRIFFPVYSKGAVVRAPKGSLGIMCFETQDSAKAFIHKTELQNVSIIPVLGLGHPMKPRVPAYQCFYIKNLYTAFTNLKKPIPANKYIYEGTICFSRVRVLE